MILAAVLALTLCATSLQAQQVADLAPEWRVRNASGSCGHASTSMALNWVQEFEKGRRWWSTYRNGEYWQRHLGRLRSQGVRYIATSDGDERLLDYAARSRRGAVVYHPPFHITNYVGKVTRDGRQYACILDNNTPQRIDLHPYDRWLSSWRRCSGCCFVILNGTPPPPVPEI